MAGIAIGVAAGSSALVFGPAIVVKSVLGSGVVGGLAVWAFTDNSGRTSVLLKSFALIGTVALMASGMSFLLLGRQGVRLAAYRNSSLPATSNFEHPRGATFFKGEFFAVGMRFSDSDGKDYRDGRIWRSVDGIVWNKVGHNHEMFGGVTRPDGIPSLRSLYGIATDGQKMIAVGSDTHDDGEGEGDVAFWSTSDGESWARVSNASTTSLAGDQVLRDIAFGQGKWLAVGHGDTDADVWSSSDGLQWIRQKPIGPNGIVIAAIEFFGGQWVAVGQSYNTDPDAGENDYAYDATVWYSANGESWLSSSDRSLVGRAGAQEMRSVAYAWGRWVAVGSDDSADPNSWDGAIWTSTNGKNWEKLSAPVLVGLDRGQRFDAVVVGPRSIIVLGHVLGTPRVFPFILALNKERLSGIDFRRGNTFAVEDEDNVGTLLAPA